VSLSGQLVDESGVNPLVAALCRVPVVLITGDQHAAVQAAPLRPGAETVVVKQSLTRRAARNLHQVAARRLI
jgi:D-amino peptidase